MNICFAIGTLNYSGAEKIVREALIKSGVHDAQSDFSSDCIKTTQAYCRMSRSFCAGWRKICKQNVRQVEDVI